MATLVIMPRQGQSVESCVITEWKKHKGDHVDVKDVLFSYETDKSAFDEEASVSGTLLEVFAEEGDDVPCLDPVCIIGEVGEDITALLKEAASKEPDGKPASVETAPAETAPASESKPDPAVSKTVPAEDRPDGFLRISPRARRLAEKTGADPLLAIGTGPSGRIVERDIQAVLDRGPVPKEEPVQASADASDYEEIKIPNIRRVIAKAMHASLSEMAQLTLNSSFDAAKIVSLRASVKAGGEALGLGNITLNDMILYAVARTLKSHRDLNANYLADKEVLRYFRHVNLGVAVDTPRGLLVPTVFAADTLSLSAISAKTKDLISASKSGTISPDLLSGGSFTVTNLGSLGIESFTPVINPPQTAILGVDCITRRVKNVGGTDIFYDAMGLSLTFDHRVLDGAPAAKFLKELCFNLENFDLLLLAEQNKEA
ncbi:MAG: 2-oxo acid dehydrogenase subunit E2 [Clostridia bacterium]|nr:2-oxo acid dehydrogenase subunit E2 [Clostridia bacterium]